MFIVIDDRELVREAYRSAFDDAGVSASKFGANEFLEWLQSAADADVDAVEAFIAGSFDAREAFPRLVRRRSAAPLLVLSEVNSLEQTLDLFAAGVDDVVRKPVHVREIIARVGVIRRRMAPVVEKAACEGLVVFFDGRDPEVNGEVLTLPRRERRILEYLVANTGKRVTKSQIFNAIYGLFDEDVDEAVVESHVSKLRKKLRSRLGHDPIEAKRYLGYCYYRSATQDDADHVVARNEQLAESFA